MAKNTPRALADILAECVNTWEMATGNPPWDSYKCAAIIDIMISLRAIRRALECDNVRRSALSMQALERLAREFWVKPTVKNKRKPAKL